MDCCKEIEVVWVKDKQMPWDHTNHDKTHLAHSFFMIVVHLADQSITEVHGDALDRLILPALIEDVQQQLVDSTVLELQLLGNAEVTQCQAAVALYLGQREANAAPGGYKNLTPSPHVLSLLCAETIFLFDHYH